MRLIYGAGGLATEVLSCLRDADIEVHGFVVDETVKLEIQFFCGLPIYTIKQIRKMDVLLYRGVGSPIAISLSDPDLRFATFAHPSACISRMAEVGDGCFFAQNVVLTGRPVLGERVYVNVGAVVASGVSVGNYTTISPCALVCDGVQVGSRCWIGVGAIIREGQKIGDSVTIGAGAVVTKDIPDGETWIGVPARRHDSNQKVE